ncbi:MAG: apolipoprotein N-acyltransferase, partial [Bacteroidales bacterium]|nr:apolipoprotein N-acyltransferase [Bacteroidales bacterium]
SRLTPGIEIMPFAGKVKFIEKLAVDLGGTVGTLGVDEGPHVFADGDTMPKFSAIICYEAGFPDDVASCVNAGAELLFVSTNDGWWGNTPGHRQHASYARLRAVENRRDIARSANTGISCFINQRGDVFQATDYWQPACIRATLHASSHLTFYARYGEILGRCSLFMSLFFLLLTFIYRLFPQAWRDFGKEKTIE